MKKIALDYNFNGHQKFHLVIIFFILWGGSTKILSQYLPIDNPRNTLPIFLAMYVVFAYSKKGLVYSKNALYKGYFFVNIVLFKTKIKREQLSKYSFLSSRKTQKYAFFSAAKPDLGHDFITHDLYLLNEKHTVKKYIFRLRSEKQKNNALAFIKGLDILTFEIYSPDFS